jgi:signal transduction histidine kinase/HAMP domain-containing protein
MLRRRLYSGLLPLLTLLVVLNVVVILQIRSLDTTFERIQLENYRSILSLRNLTVEASRLTMAAILARNDLDDQALLTARESLDGLRNELRVLGAATGADAEMRLISVVNANCQDLMHLFRGYVAQEEGPPSPSEVQSLVNRIASASEHLISYNRSQLLERGREFRWQTRLSNYFILVATGMAILFAITFSRLLSRRILAPIERLTVSTRQIAGGNWDITIDRSASDEIGELALVLNDMMVQLLEYRRLTDRKLLRSRRRMGEFMDNSPDAIFFVNARREPTYKNPRARRLWDVLEWESGFPEELERDIGQVLREGGAVIPGDLGSALIFTIDGKRFAFLPLITPLEAEDQDGREVAVVLQDVSKMRLANDLKSNLLATVSHEIKTPLTSARMALYLVLDGEIGMLNDKQRDLLETTRGDLERLLTLLNNILDFARLEAGVARMTFQPTAPLALMTRVRSEFAQAATSAHIDLKLLTEPGLTEVPVDRARIHVVLTSFVSNALKHSPGGAQVLLYVRRDGEGVRFGVVDHGSGVPKDMEHNIFERFSRASGDTNGAGLGLSISREIVVAHGGSIGYDSSSGTDFYFILPTGGHGSDAALHETS